ncbi:MmgE/PrpD family protein [bacterium]|nr:MmgE/PrpD family protein [bacterium]
MAAKNYTQQIAGYITATRPDTIAPVEFEFAKVALMDWVSVALAGMNEPLSLQLIQHAELLGGNEQATILGHDKRFNVAYGALVNGAMSHALDYDDSMMTFIGHPSVALFPGILALSEWRQKSGLELLTAFLVGLQTGSMIGVCAGFEHYAKGWHGTGTIGRMASTAACSNLLGLNQDVVTYALGIGGTQSCGLKQVFGTMCKPLNAGGAAQGGVTASLLAEGGFDSATDILEGAQGFGVALTVDFDKLELAQPGEVGIVQSISHKFHASCHLTHSPIESLLSVMKESGIVAGNVETVEVNVAPFAIQTAPIMDPKTGLEGKFCIGYCVANALLRRDTGIAAFTDEMVNDPEIKKLMEKITVVPTERLQENRMKAEVNVITTDKKTLSGSFDVADDNPDLKTRQEKIGVKFDSLCVPILGQRQAAELKNVIETIDQAESVVEMIRLCSVKS